MMYNTPYISVTGAFKHPSSLGQPMKVVWAETWDTLGGPVEMAAAQGKSLYREDDLFFLERRNEIDGTIMLEEVYATVCPTALCMTSA
jgi:hypothetical protein